MAEVQTQPSKEDLSQPQISYDVVAATITGPLHKTLTPAIRINLWEAGQFNHVSEAEDELPPYESVSVDKFVINLEEMRICSCYNMTQTSSNHILCQPVTRCPTFAIHNDFILFPSQSECPSDEESSVVSCFTDDLSTGTGCCTENLYNLSSPDASPSSAEVFETSVLKSKLFDDHQHSTRSNKKIADWLCNVEADVAHAHHEGMLLQEGTVLMNLDERKDLTEEGVAEPAA
jgi:hypothetical protein